MSKVTKNKMGMAYTIPIFLAEIWGFLAKTLSWLSLTPNPISIYDVQHRKGHA